MCPNRNGNEPHREARIIVTRFPDTVHNEDCIEGMRKLAAGSVDLAFADPPFNIG
jgi:DNA modification methylase